MTLPESAVGDVVYELALLQFRPAIASDEAINVGVFAVAERNAYAAYRFSDRYGRLTSVFPGLDGAAYRALIRTLDARARTVLEQLGSVSQPRLIEQSPTFQHPKEIREAVLAQGGATFRWSSVRVGVCRDLDERVAEAFEEYVGRFEASGDRPRIDDEAVWQRVAQDHAVAEVLKKLDIGVQLSSERYEYRFRAGWMNGRQQVVEPISLDYSEPRQMVEEALRWRGRLEELGAGRTFLMTALVTDSLQSSASYEDKYKDAVSVLRDCPGVRDVFAISEATSFAELVERDIASHH